MSPRSTDGDEKSFSAYALRKSGGGKRQLALRGQVGLTGVDPQTRTTWVHVAPPGTWEGHAAGAFTLTPEAFESIVEHDRAREAPISWDYEHASIDPQGGPTPASGYVVALEAREDGLWAQTEFTKRAAQMIADGEYRFCSGVFDFDSPDPVTGETLPCVLDSIALTNRPFIAGMEPIALTKKAAGEPMARKPLATPAPKTPVASTARKPAANPPPSSLADASKGIKFSRKALDAALDNLDSDTVTPAAINAIVDGLTAYTRARAANMDEPDVADEGGDGSGDADGGDGGGAAASKGKRANTGPTVPGQGAPQDVTQTDDPAPETRTTPVPPEQGAPQPTPTAVAPPDSPDDGSIPPAPADDEDDDSQTDAIMAKIAEATGLTDDGAMAAALEAHMDEIVACLTDSDDGTTATTRSKDLVIATMQKSLIEAKRQLNEANAKVVAATKRDHEAEMDAEVEELVTSGRIHPSSRKEWRALARSSSKEFRAAAKTLQPVFPTSRAPAPPPPASGGPENIVPPEGSIDPKDPVVVECTAALDATDKQLVKMGLKPMSKETRETHVRAALARTKPSQSTAPRAAN